MSLFTPDITRMFTLWLLVSVCRSPGFAAFFAAFLGADFLGAPMRLPARSLPYNMPHACFTASAWLKRGFFFRSFAASLTAALKRARLLFCASVICLILFLSTVAFHRRPIGCRRWMPWYRFVPALRLVAPGSGMNRSVLSSLHSGSPPGAAGWLLPILSGSLPSVSRPPLDASSG